MASQASPKDASSPKSASSPKAASPKDAHADVAADILPAQHWTDNAVEETEEDADSTLGTDVESSTASITSSILKYRTIHGRSFHSEQGNAQYWASNDETQNELMDINHHIMTLGIDHNLYKAPLDHSKVKNILDIGTGTGIWAVDAADMHPDAQVIGTDLSPIQPTWVPPNCRFEIEDCTQEWTFASNSQDFVHMRWLSGSIPDWSALMREAVRVCRPGGWVQSWEPSAQLISDDETVPADSAMGQWGKFFIEGGRKIGNTFTVVEDELQRKVMEEAGLVDIQEFYFKNPIGAWPKDARLKEMGRFAAYNLTADSEGFIAFMAHALEWKPEEIQVYVAHFRAQIKSSKQHGYYTQRVVWGRKPE